jgi:hypothetical protein
MQLQLPPPEYLEHPAQEWVWLHRHLPGKPSAPVSERILFSSGKFTFLYSKTCGF